jgi:endonuclease YncB( thermonuclease family)
MSVTTPGSIRRLIAAIALIAGALIFALPATAQRADSDWEIPEDAVPIEFIDVIDGDTFDARVMQENGQFREERIRMIGIDTPETNYSFGNEPECYGEQATGRAEALLLDASEIWVTSDVSDRDPNGRLLRYVWTVSKLDGKVHFINEQLVLEGYAEARTYHPDTEYQDVLDKAERDAISEGRGMWLTCDASVSMDPDLEDEDGPDSEPIDRTLTPIDDEEAVCSFFDNFDQAQEFLEIYPELEDVLDADGDGLACEGYFLGI